MQLLWRRRPNVRKLARRQDAGRLVAALMYTNLLTDHPGRVYDLGASVRRDAALALASIHNTDDIDACPALIRSLQDPSSEVRRAAASALGIRADRRAIPALAEAAVTWTDPRYGAARAMAVESLSTMDGRETAERCVTAVVERGEDMESALGVLARLVGNGDTQTRQAALSAATVALWRQTGKPAERAAEIMMWLGPGSADPLIDLLERRGPRLPAIRALGRLGDLRATDALTPLLTDPDPDIRRAAAAALGGTADLRARGPLLEAGTDPDHLVREAAIAALAKLAPMAIGRELLAGPGA